MKTHKTNIFLDETNQDFPIEQLSLDKDLVMENFTNNATFKRELNSILQSSVNSEVYKTCDENKTTLMTEKVPMYITGKGKGKGKVKIKKRQIQKELMTENDDRKLQKRGNFEVKSKENENSRKRRKIELKSQEEKIGTKKNLFDEDSNEGGNISEENTDVCEAQICEFPDLKLKYDKENLRALIQKFISNISVVNTYPAEVNAFYQCVIHQNYLLF